MPIMITAMPSSSMARWRKNSVAPGGRKRAEVTVSLIDASAMVLQQLRHAGERAPGGVEVLHQRDADIALARIHAVDLARDVAAGQHLDAAIGPQSARRLLAVADIEPQEEAAIGHEEAALVVQDRLCRLEARLVLAADRRDMAFLAPQRGGGVLNGERHLWPAIGLP